MAYTHYTPHQYAAYKAAHQTTDNKTQQVVMLYDGMMRHVNVAKKAIAENNVQDRFDALEKTSQILLGLQASLDFENGGDIAPILDSFYNTLYTKVHTINRTNDLALCDDVIESLKGMRESWQLVHEEVAPQKNTPLPEAAPAQESTTPTDGDSGFRVSV